MITCKEFVLDDAIAITAIPVKDFVLGTLQWQLAPTIPESDFSPNLNNSVTIGNRPAVAGTPLVPIVSKTGKAEDDENNSTAGCLHDVTVTCEIDERDETVWNNLLTLERTPSHLLLTFRDGGRAFVAATRDSYLCTKNRSGSKTSVKFRLQNLLGIQPIV